MNFKVIKSNEGNAYIFVLIVVMTVLVIISIILNLAEYNTKLTNRYKSNAYLYEHAVYGVEDAVSRINKKMSNYKMYISEKILNDIFNESLGDNVYYGLSSLQNKYEGDFYLKGIFVNKFKNYIKEVLSNENYEYEIIDEDNTIKVEVEIYIDEEEIKVKSKAKKVGSDSFRVVEGKGKISEGIEEVLVPNFRWRESYDWTNYGIYAKGEVIYEDEEVHEEVAENGYFNVYNEAFLNKVIWEENNSIIVEKGFNSAYVDISDFYINGEPIKTAIIIENPVDTLIYSSNPYENKFEGIIYAKNNVTVMDIELRGTILCEQDVYVKNVNIETDNDMLFKINIKDNELKFRLYDYFRATDFNNISKEKNEVQNILFKTEFENNGTVFIDLIEDLYYKIITIF